MIAIAWKGTVILLAMFAAARLLRHRSAALRHSVWTAGFAALLLLPVWPSAGPSWTPRTAVPDSGITRLVVTPAPRPSPAPTFPWLAAIYAAGCAFAAARFALGAVRTAWISRRAVPDAGWSHDFGVRVVTTPAAPMPLAWGVLRPTVVLPSVAGAWPAERLRSVVLHERTHLERRDLLTHAIAQAACCLYWFHPLAWLGLARLRQEREQACDDAVIATGVAAHDYASHLMDIVRAEADRRASWADAPAMADASNFETRVRALLDRRCDRRPLTRGAAAAVMMIALLVLVPVATLKLRAQSAAAGSITGTVTDPSGAMVPRSRVLVRSLGQPSFEVSATTDAVGAYKLNSLPPGEYSVEFAAPGFAPLKSKAVLVAGAAARVDANLELGGISENVTVKGTNGTVPLARPAWTPVRVKIGGNVQPSKLLSKVDPEYPVELQRAGVEGTVIIRAVVSTSGTLLNPQVVNAVDARLAKAALDAVSQWSYQPSLLNGQPVEAATTISVDFRLGQ
jgi:TonB family protein